MARPNGFTRSLFVEVLLLILLAAMTPTLVVGYLTFTGAKAELKNAQLEKLETARDRGKENIANYLAGTLRNLEMLASTWSVRLLCKTLPYSGINLEDSAAAAKHFASNSYKTVTTDIDTMLDQWLALYEAADAYHDVLLITGRDPGKVLYTKKRKSDLGSILKPESAQSNPLARLWKKVVETDKPAVVDFHYYEPAKEVSAFVGAPIHHEKGTFMGVLALRLGPEGIDRIVRGVSKLGKTGDACIVGQDFLLRSNLGSDDDAVLKRKLDTEAAKEALAGKSGVGEYPGPDGVLQLNAWSMVGLQARKDLGADFDWGIIATINSTEAFGAVDALRYRALLLTLGMGVLLSGITFLLTRPAVSTIVNLAGLAGRVSEGDLTVEVRESRRADEIGGLARTFRTMVTNLREQIGKIREVVTVLAGAASEISSTVSQVASGASQTFSAVVETTTTVEEVRQAASLASDKAKSVARTAQQAVQISETGQEATRETVQKINLIMEQMESIGSTVVRLSGHSRAIEEIIGTVQDLAEQSNLLAVNASIEAARAGDQGKGFAVVAQEIKTLADQSREATVQVRTILDDTKKWISAVVMAAEQGGRAVQAGVQQSSLAGESIQTLAGSVSASAHTANVIEASSEQQSAGVEQVANAMASIEQVAKQNLAGTARLEESAKKLATLGEELKELIRMYTVL